MRTAHASWSSVLDSTLEALRPGTVLYSGAREAETVLGVASWCSANEALVHAVAPAAGAPRLPVDTPGLVLHARGLLDTLVQVEDLELVIVASDPGTGVLDRVLQLLERRALDGALFPVVIVRDLGVTPLRAFVSRSGLGLAAVDGGSGLAALASSKSSSRLKWLRKPALAEAAIDASTASTAARAAALVEELSALSEERAELERRAERAELALEVARAREAALQTGEAEQRELSRGLREQIDSARRAIHRLEGEVADAGRRAGDVEQRLGEALREVERLEAVQRRLVDERDAGGRALEEATHDRQVIAGHARRVAASRSWRFGHRLMWIIGKLTFRTVRRDSALDVMIDRLERPIELPAGRAGSQPEPEEDDGPSSPPRRHPLADAALSRIASVGTVSVVVPVYNAHDELDRCVETLIRNTTRDAELVLIDDASTDPRVGLLLDTFAQLENVRVLRNERNLGFTRTANRGFAETAGDVVLLNSDTLVPPRWLENLVRTAYSGEAIGTVTPLSDNAGAFSAPVVGGPNDTPATLSVDEVGRLVARAGGRRAPETPTASGFCMYVKRSCLDETGDFDAEAFPRGYGEENDFCMRAGRKGWRHVVDDTTFVLHRRESSFGDEKQALAGPARDALDRRHPDYTERVRNFVRSADMEAARGEVRRAFARAAEEQLEIRPRVLLVLHEGGGGTPATTVDLIRGLAERWECLAFTSNAKQLKLWRGGAGGMRQLDEWPLEPIWRATQFTRADYRRVASAVLLDHAIELVHVRHLFKHTFDLPQIATALGIPLVMSFHDFYLACPTVHLLDEQDRFCAAHCTPGDGACRIPSPLLEGLPPLKHRWVKQWQGKIAPMLASADAAVTTSEHARGLLRDRYPALHGKRFEVIEHGRDLRQAVDVVERPGDGPVRIVVPGNLDVHKGLHLLRAIKELDRDGIVEFHFLGAVPEGYEDLGVQHGPYERAEFEDRLRQISPSFVGVFSITAETYCHSLSEAWAAGVPVIATDIGALGERVSRRGAGVLIPHDDPAAAYERILAAIADRAGWDRLRSEAHVGGLPTVSDMAREYDILYRSVLAARRPLRPKPGSVTLARHRPRVLRVDAFVPRGDDGSFPGSTHVRVLRRLRHPGVSWKLDTRLHNGGASTDDVAGDVVLVQRTGVSPDQVERLLDRVAALEAPMVMELDDDLFALGRGDRDYGSQLGGLGKLIEAADMLMVSTEALRVGLSGRNRRIEVVPNMIDERLWFRPSDQIRPTRRSDGALRLVYMGSPTHEQDLAMLRPVVDALRRDVGLDVELSVIGGEPVREGRTWYSRVLVPPGKAEYPDFVRWLRRQAGGWDVAVAPLVDTPLNRAKSDLKLLEYAALGLPGVYSDMPVYSTCRDRDIGVLVPNTTEAWCNELARLHADSGRRFQIASAAREYVRAERCLSHQASDYLELLASAAGSA